MPPATFFALTYRLCSDTAKEQLNGENELYLGDHADFLRSSTNRLQGPKDFHIIKMLPLKVTKITRL